MKRIVTLLVLVVVNLALSVEAVRACPLCKEAVPSSGDGTNLDGDDAQAVEQAKAWNNSIYVFIAAPYLLVGGVGFLVYRNFRKSRPSSLTSAPPEPDR
jgi:hypothetical protein